MWNHISQFLPFIIAMMGWVVSARISYESQKRQQLLVYRQDLKILASEHIPNLVDNPCKIKRLLLLNRVEMEKRTAKLLFSNKLFFIFALKKNKILDEKFDLLINFVDEEGQELAAKNTDNIFKEHFIIDGQKIILDILEQLQL